MQNLRIINVQVNNSSNIDVIFTHKLTTNLTVSNVIIIADTADVPSPDVLEIKIVSNTLSIRCQPLTPLASYFIKFISTNIHPFISLNGEAKISEDGVSNKYLILGPLAPDNVVKNYFLSYFKDNIYDLNDDNAPIAKYINSLSIALSRALYDIGQLKNENYLSFTITDEQKVRGEGPFDRLNEEGAYDIIRVGKNVSTANSSMVFSIDSFPTYPITLQRQNNIEYLKTNSIDEIGYFNINNLILTLNKSPVTKITSIIFTLITNNPIYVYNIEKLGYQIKNSRYDQEFSFDYILLNDNQVKISDKVLEDPNFSLSNIFSIEIKYESKDLGRVVQNNTLSITTVKNSIREVLPPIINIFNLKHAPIVDSNGNMSQLNGVIFTDPNTTTGSKHPAFVTELPFRLNGLPFAPGQYSIDYMTGTVYVYGANLSNNGTGFSPPLASYNYLLTYKQDQDYIYDFDLLDLVALPYGNLISSQGNINFSYEEVLIPGTDYIAGLHQEALTERINNNLVAVNTIKTLHSPITNVFRIYNETSGEIYTLDRWNNDKIYFRYNNPPRLGQATNERVSFNTIVNELLFINSSFINSSNINIIKVFLKNNSIISSTEDSLSSSFNTSLIFTNNNIFINEKWYDRQSEELLNVNRLLNVGEYMVDYMNGIIYCAVNDPQNFNIGTVSYKNKSITTLSPHIISVEDIYYQTDILGKRNKKFSYLSFNDNSIIPDVLDYADELSLNNDPTSIYQINNNSVGTFINNVIFVPGVTNQIKFVRSVYEYNDLVNSIHPLDFAKFASSDGFNININPISGQTFENVQFDGTNYYVLINQNIPYLSNAITYTFNIIRLSDSAILWDNSSIIVPGSPIKLILSGTGSPLEGDLVSISYTFNINNLSRLVVDYNKGEYYVDYTYVADEIIISYEYGDNVIDFRKNRNLPPSTTYYVTYKAGALRDALLRNFGTLVDIPELSNFDIDFNRERYRDALIAGLTSFIQGPTVSAIKNIGRTISHITPKVIESAFQNWSLGNSLLSQEKIKTTGNFQLLPAKFDNGVLINSSDQTIKFPLNSNIRFEEGTFETWINPLWNGLDNDAILNFHILQDGYVIDPAKIFIGISEYHPLIIDGTFSISKLNNVSGVPNKNKDGIFIYYDLDTSGNFQRWYVEVIDGYVSSNPSNYKFKIMSTGIFYDTKSLHIPKPSNLNIFTGTDSINFNINGTTTISEGITFISDIDHYILDAGEEKNKNRLSIYKDISGYLNFRVYDNNKVPYTVSADISGWKAGDLHHMAASWKLNTINRRDEMHLFIDGFEVPNIIKYGQKLKPYLHEKFRTVDPEEIIGLADRDIIASTDLQIAMGSSTVSSSINFSSYNISIGDIIHIDEIGFADSGYTILSINGQNLTLSSSMPKSLNNARFSINRTQFTVISDIDVSPNIAISTIRALISGTDINANAGSNLIVSSSINFSTLNIKPGYTIRINNLSLRTVYTILQVTGNSLVIDDMIPIDIINTDFKIYTHTENEIPGIRALYPAYSISKDANFNNVLTISDKIFAGDLILIRTLGLNHRKIKKEYYVWSDGVENILMTNLPSPISLDEVKITKVILPKTSIDLNNSVLSSDILTSNNLLTTQPSSVQNGRTLSVNLSGTNIDFSFPVQITINGISNNNTINENIVFNDYGTLDFINIYSSINYINISVKPLNINKSAAVIAVKEKYSITYPESDGYGPVLRFSHSIAYGYTLYQNGINKVTDNNNSFSNLDINNYLFITSPANVAGFYKITEVSDDRKTLSIDTGNTSLGSFSNGIYQILNVNIYRSGLQNGFFTFENNMLFGQPYFLNKGIYEFDYFTYIKIKLDPMNTKVFLGTDYQGSHQLDGIMDQVKIYSSMLTDTRIGENIPINQRSITKDFNSLKSLTQDINTLMLIDFNRFPFTNSADFYTSLGSIKKHFYSSIVVNENFGNSLVLLDDPIILSNDGILDAKREGTIEFWTSPLFDTYNDPNKRFYFDAFGAVVEEAVSVDNVSIKLPNAVGTILSVKLKNGDPHIDYFAGGKIEIDTQNAILEESVSISNNSVIVSKPALQIISIKIIGDLTNIDYFTNGSISTDMKTIYLGRLLPTNNLPLSIVYQTTENNNRTINSQIIRLNKKLPYQKSHVIVNYIPKGMQGDRISIFKDEIGYMNFAITASHQNYVVRAPVLWAKNTWHRVKVSYKVNSKNNTDEMRLFLDGYQYNNILIGNNILFGNSPIITGGVVLGDGYGSLGNVNFKDFINELFIGTQYNKEFPIFALIDNLRISGNSKPIYAPYGEPIDVNYTSNLEMAFPVTEDLFTTYLLNSDTISVIADDFVVLKNRQTGLFDFSVNIIDSLGIVSSSIKSREALEKLIKVLKPANSRVFIQYTK